MNIDVICSLIIGFIVGLCLFFCVSDRKIYRGPNSESIKSVIYKVSSDGKCYVLEPKIYLCPNNV